MEIYNTREQRGIGARSCDHIKIVIFKEEGVDFASDFSDFGYISFEKDKLDAKAMDLMKELVGFGILQISAT